MSIFPDINPNTTSGTQLATLLNSFRDSFASTNSAGARDPELVAGGMWVDTTSDPIWSVNIYDGTDDIEFMSVNTTTNSISFGDTADSLSVEKITDDSLGAILELFKRRISGTGQTQAGDTLGELNFSGYTDGATKEIQCQIKSITNENVTAGVHGAYISISTTQDGTSSLVERVRVTDTGLVGFGESIPTARVHVKGNSVTGNIKNHLVEDSTVGAKTIKKKSRIAASGQVISGDTIASDEYVSTDEAGAERILAETKVTATENTVSTQHGSKYSISTTRIGSTALVEDILVEEGTTTIKSTTSSTTKDTGALVVEGGVGIEENLHVGGNFTVEGTTTTINTATLDVEDVNVTINKNGNQATADDAAGITVEMSDATNVGVIHDKDVATKWKVGNIGAEVAIVDESTAQDVSNKAIKTPSQLDAKQGLFSALVTYALTATDGQFCFATDQKVMYQVVDNALTAVGSGGGGLDSWLNEAFDVTDHSDFTTGNNVFFDNGGVLNGALSSETASPITGARSIKYVAGAASQNDWIASPVVDLDVKQKENDSSITKYFTWDGTVDVKVVVYDVTNSKILTSILDVVSTETKATRFETNFYPPANCTQVKYGYHFVNAPTNGDILIFDDVEFSTDPYSYKELIDTQSYRANTLAGYGSVDNKIPYFTNEVENIGDGIIVVGNDSTNGFTMTATRDCVLTVSMSVNYNATEPFGFSLNSNQLTIGIASITLSDRLSYSDTISAGNNHITTTEIKLSANDVVRPHTHSAATFSTADRNHISFTAIATSEYVVAPAKSNINSYSARIANNGTASIVSQDYSGIASVLNTGIGRVTVTFTTDLFTVIPAISAIVSDSVGFGNFIIEADAASTSSVLIRTFNDAGATIDVDFDITINKQGIDVKNAKFLGVIPTQKIAYVNVHATNYTNFLTATTAYKTIILDSVTGNTDFASVSTNQLTLRKGLYNLHVPVAAFNGSTWLALLLYNITGAVNHEEFLDVCHSQVLSMSFNTVLIEVEITEEKTFELRTKSSVASGEEYYSRIKIIKLR